VRIIAPTIAHDESQIIAVKMHRAARKGCFNRFGIVIADATVKGLAVKKTSVLTNVFPISKPVFMTRLFATFGWAYMPLVACLEI